MELQRIAISPVNSLAKMNRDFFRHSFNPMSYTELGRSTAASWELLERMTRKFSKPEFGITESVVGDAPVSVSIRAMRRKPFCVLQHFAKKNITKAQKNIIHKETGEMPRDVDPGVLSNQDVMLVVAPMSGHYATLLRGTVKGLLPHYDVYTTDWVNASDVPLSKGTFDLDDYINYIMAFIQAVSANGSRRVHVMGVCQPAVPVLAAVSLMSTMRSRYTPDSMILVGGPIDTRQNPTEVNTLAEKRSLEWFEKNVISQVPFNYAGFMRPVYPGFIQLTGFMTMNMDRHLEAHFDLFSHLVEGDGDSVGAHKKFYNEYLSVMDITAEFYLQTIKTVFQDHSLPKGEMISRGRPIRPQDITKTAVFSIEGERDDISGKNQTKAALDLCASLPAKKKSHLMQKGVGHYGLFNGRRFREEIVPAICKFTRDL